MQAKVENIPQMTLKVKMEHSCRHNIMLSFNYANNANQLIPSGDLPGLSSFNFQGGPRYMQGGLSPDPIEIGFDFGYWHLNKDVGKIFFVVEEYDPNSTHSGYIEYVSFIDHRWGEEFEIYCNESNVEIINNEETVLSIDYDLIPFDIVEDLELFSNMISRFNPTVHSNVILTVEEGVKIDLFDSEIHVDNQGSLILEDNVIFIAKTGTCKIVIDGEVTFGSNISFVVEDEASLELQLNNTSQSVTINNAVFNKTKLNSNVANLTMSSSDIIDGEINGSNGNIEINNCEFENSFVSLSNALVDSYSSEINECEFTLEDETYAITINDYAEFSISNCVFINNHGGIYIYNSGDGRYSSEIIGCNISGGSLAAIQAYNSDVAIIDNYIEGNYFGIRSLNNSNVKVTQSEGLIPQSTIADNTYYEVFASSGAFPYYFKYNEIIDDDNTEPLVYYSGTSGELDVSNNYWGGAYFNPNSDLYPTYLYNWIPLWDPYEKSVNIAGSLYESALEKIEQEDYSGAIGDLKEIIEEHTSTIFAQAAIKKLFSVEQYAENDYMGLKSYLSSEPAIQSEEELVKISEFLINFCEIRLNNWETAISWFESVIQNPPNMEDSIFSIIDLGYTYLVMEQGGYKAAYTGSMLEHIPKSKQAFVENRQYLLSLIPKKKMSEQMQQSIRQLEGGQLLYNVPNPFRKSTQIWYKLDEESDVAINVLDFPGKDVLRFNIGKKEKGHHSIELKSDFLPSGIYFYNLEINGRVSDTKKMAIIK